MRRHQNAHAVVNAGFSVAVSGRTVGAAPVIVFGGVLPGPARAPKTEALLVGKDWAAKATLAAALASLAAELVPDARPDVATRRALVSSLFYKYWVPPRPPPTRGGPRPNGARVRSRRARGAPPATH